MDDQDWKTKLTKEQYHLLRERGTELPGSGSLLYNTANGDYTCAGCGKVVFKSSDKYETHQPGLIGWPSFSAAAQKDVVKLSSDTSYGMSRIEVTCSNCGGHLGHLFPDDESPSGQHFCINSGALNFTPSAEKKT